MGTYLRSSNRIKNAKINSLDQRNLFTPEKHDLD
jgi:hypothetical protein